VQGISAAASFPLSDILAEKGRMNEEMNGNMGMVYQVYLEYDRSRTEERVREAVEGGVQSVFIYSPHVSAGITLTPSLEH
jgi:hypothetical protein